MPSGRKRAAFGRSESYEKGVSGRPPLNGVATRFVQNCTLSLSLKGFDAVRHRNPALCTLHPDEVAWSEPNCVIKSGGFEGKHALCGCRNMIDADSALGTEHTRKLVAAVGDTRKLLRRAGHCQAVFRHQHGHAEGAAGLALAFFAVAGNQAYRFRRQYVTHCTALASASVGCGHGAYSCQRATTILPTWPLFSR